MKANWKLKNLLPIINIKIIREVYALQICFGMLIKPEYKEVYFSKYCVYLSIIDWILKMGKAIDIHIILLLCNSVQTLGIQKCFCSSTVISFQPFKPLLTVGDAYILIIYVYNIFTTQKFYYTYPYYKECTLMFSIAYFHFYKMPFMNINKFDFMIH